MTPQIMNAIQKGTEELLRIAGPASKLVGSAAALEVARNVAQVMISDPTMHITEVCLEAARQRVAHPETYGASWRGVSALAVSKALIEGWRLR